MKKFLLFFLLVLSSLGAYAQVPSWQQAITSGLGGTLTINNIATAANGFVYITGGFSNSVSLGNTTLTSNGATDIFIAKCYKGGVVWAQNIGGAGSEAGQSIVLSGNNIYIAGSFSGTSTFGVSNGGSDLFIAKLTDSGTGVNLIWSQVAGGTRSDQAIALAVNGSSVYLTGNFSSPALSFGTVPPLLNSTAPTSTNSNITDVFVAKATDNGATASFVWAQKIGGIGLEEVQGIAVEGTSIYLAGSFYSATAIFGPLTLTNFDTSTNPSNDVFLTKLTDTGNNSSFIWAQRFGGTNEDYAHGVVAKGTSIYLLGENGSASFAFGNTTLTNAGGLDIIVGKLTDTGANATVNWVQQIGGQYFEVAFAMTMQGSDIYLGGSFSNELTIGSSTVISTGSTPGVISRDDAFLAKLTDNGATATPQWVQAGGGAGSDYGYSVAANGTDIYLSGRLISAPANFGNLLISNPTNRQTTPFLAFLVDNAASGGPLATLPPVIGQGTEQAVVYPNPSAGSAGVHVALHSLAGEQVTVHVADMLGRTIAVQKFVSAGNQPDLPLSLPEKLPTGIYVITLSTATRTWTTRWTLGSE